MAVDQRGDRIAVGDDDGTISIWDLRRHVEVLPRPKLPNTWIVRVEWSSDGRRIVAAGYSGLAQVFDASNGVPLGAPIRHEGALRWATFSPDGTRVATSDRIGMARVWVANTGAPVTPFLRQPKGDVNSIVFSPDGREVITAHENGQVTVWDAATGRLTWSAHPTEAEAAYAEFSPDSKSRAVIAAFQDNRARIWDRNHEGAPLVLQHSHHVLRARFSSDGLRVATASIDRSARIWDARTGAPLTAPIVHPGRVWNAIFSTDGDLLATTSIDGTARVWDARSGLAVTPPMPNGGSVQVAAFVGNDRALVTASTDGNVRFWDLTPDQRPIADLERVARLLALEGLDGNGDIQPIGEREFRADWAALQGRILPKDQ